VVAFLAWLVEERRVAASTQMQALEGTPRDGGCRPRTLEAAS
jgi:hypothetical protein